MIGYGERGLTLKGNTYWFASEIQFKNSFLVCFDFTRETFWSHLPLPFEDAYPEDTIDEPNTVSWNNKVFLSADIRQLIHPQWQFPVSASFFIEEEKKIAVVFAKDTDIQNPTREVAYIIGVDGSIKAADVRECADKVLTALHPICLERRCGMHSPSSQKLFLAMTFPGAPGWNRSSRCRGSKRQYVLSVVEALSGEESEESDDVVDDPDYDPLQDFLEQGNRLFGSYEKVELANVELSNLIAALGDKSYIGIPDKTSGTIKEKLSAIAPAPEQYLWQQKEERSDRLNKVLEFASTVHLCAVLGLDFLTTITESDRLNKVLEFASTVHLCAVLGLDFLTTITEVHPSLDGVQNKSISNETLSRLAETVLTPKEDKNQRRKKELAAQLADL
ncbi:hypothetical protein F2Q70_00035321 [Brassica cretica]|uniref:F-box associated beta-propeller type 1 domain-containing protein n=1 Tax=Brassica cretica TaxID=69181 RepID=A0A8S9JX62_BRACR|nr:hypothetical protein F2Q70_00035321 [Brassica cretica]